MKGLLVLAHGSKVTQMQTTFQRYVDALSSRSEYDYVMGAYLQMMSPNFNEAIESLVNKGIEKIDVLPFFLFKGNHMMMSIPTEIESAQLNHPGLIIRLMDCIGYDEALVELVLKRLHQLP